MESDGTANAAQIIQTQKEEQIRIECNETEGKQSH